MKKTFAAVILGFSFAGNCFASGFSLNAATPAKLLAPAAAAGKISIPEVPAPQAAKARTGSYVRVSGHVSLSGNTWINGSGGFNSVTLTGWATFRDATGRITSNNAHISTLASMWIYPNQHVFQTVRPSVYVQLYRDGKPVGSANMSGSISVSGWPSSNYVTLNGSGYLEGSLYVEDAD